MIVLDTNVISELGKARPDPNVLEWIVRSDKANLFLCSVVLMEQIYGAEKMRLKSGSNKFYLSIENVRDKFRGQIIEWTTATAELTGRLLAKRDVAGRPISTQDAMIAAICLHHGAALATRNTKDFEGLDLRLVNPFEDG